MEWAEQERIRLQIEAEAGQRFPEAVQAVMVLERPQLLAGLTHSEPWRVKTGKIIVRVLAGRAGPAPRDLTPVIARLRPSGARRLPSLT